MENKNYNYKLFIIIIYLFVFQELLEKYISIFQYFDEFYAFMLIPVLIIKNRNLFSSGIVKVNKQYVKQFFMIFLILVIGILSNFRNHFQGFSAIFYDIVIFLKFPLALWLSSILFNSQMINKFKKKIKFHVNIISISLIILSILNIMFNLFHISHRYGLPVNQLFYSHPAKIVMISVLLLVLNELCKEEKHSLLTIVLCLLAISSFRSKGIGFCILALIIIIYVNKTGKKISFSKLGLLGILCAFFVFDQISVYYIDNINSPRYILTERSVMIANDNIPFGSGFASFGSYASAINYSPLYSMYGLSNIYGFTHNNYIYICDTFWPMILAQFGYIGTFCYVIYVFMLFKEIQKIDVKRNKKLYIAKILCLGYLIISSTSESSFVNPMAVSLTIIMGLSIDNEVKNEN